MLDDRDDQALPVGELDREAEVDVVPRHDLVAADLAVDPWVLAQRLDDGSGDEGEIGRVDPVGLLVLLLQLRADRDHSGHVDLDRARDVRRGVERAAHVLGDALAHRGHRLERLAGLRLGLGGGRRSGSGGRRLCRCGCGSRRSHGRRRGRRGSAAGSGGGAWTGAAGAGAGCRCRRLGLGCGHRLGLRGAGCASACAPPPSTNARMSFLVTRPPVPVPCTAFGSTPCSDAIRATTGETKVRPLPDCLRRCRAVGRGGSELTGATGASPSELETAAASSAASSVAGSEQASGRFGSGYRGAFGARSPRAPCRPRRSRPPGRGSSRRHLRRDWESRCRPCRWRSPAAPRRARSARLRTSATS